MSFHRSQIHLEERAVGGDGFMLNLLSILQNLSVKIKLNKMDFLYPFHPSSLIKINNDTRLKFTSQEVSEWLEEFGKYYRPINRNFLGIYSLIH